MTSGPRWRAQFGFLLAFAMGVGTLFNYTLSVLAPFLIADFSISRSQLGLLITVNSLAAASLAPRSGVLVDRRGGIPTLNVLFVASAGALLLLGLARNLPHLFMAAALGGLAMALTNPVTNHLLMTRIPMGRRGWLMGIKQSGAQMSSVVAGVALPAGALLVGWRGSVTGLVLLCPAGILLARRLLRSAVEVAVVPTPSRPASADPLPAGVSRVAWGLTAFAFLMAAGGSMVSTFLPLYAFEQFGVSEAVAGLTLAVAGLVGFGARVVWGPIAERFTRLTGPLMVLSLLTAVSVALLWLAPRVGFSLVWVSAVVYGTSGAAWNTAAMLALVRLAGQDRIGRLSGRMMSGAYAGGVASPIAFGFLVDRTGAYQSGWVFAMVLLVGAVMIALRLHVVNRGG